MAITPLEKQTRRIKRALREAGVSEERIESAEDPGRLLDDLDYQKQLRDRIADKIEIWIADGVLTRREATAMSDHERKTFYFRALDKYERWK